MPSDDPISRLQFARDEVGTGYPHHFIKTSSASASSCSAPRRQLLCPQVRHANADARHGSCWVSRL